MNIKFVKKTIKLFIYFLSFISIRSKKIWVISSYGLFNDNSRYFYLHSLELCDDIKLIWIAKNREEYDYVKIYGGLVFLRYSFWGLYYCLRAKVYIYSAYISEINYLTSGGVITVNLWHGIPLKNIEFDIKESILAKRFDGSLMSKMNYPYLYKKHNFILSPSEFVIDYSFLKAFKAKREDFIINMYPRVIDLLERKNKIENKEDQFFVFYAPTWRDDNSIFLNESTFNMEVMNDFLIDKNIKLFIKLHSNTNFKLNNSFSNIVILEAKEDPNEYLVKCDCLITDYSSIYIDYLVLNKPVIFYRFDEGEYISTNRDFYDLIYNSTPGNIVYKFSDLLSEIENIKNGFDSSELKRFNLRSKLSMNTASNKNDLFFKIKNKIIES